MSTVALFVDARYVLQTAGALCVDPTARRGDIDCDYPAMIDGLVDYTLNETGVGAEAFFLRCYWYDASRNGRLIGEQADIARLADVKVRLGGIVGGRQKGVSTRMVFDLLTLGLGRVIDVAVLVTDNEELCETVRTIQMSGVRVLRLNAPSSNPRGREEDLSVEVDDNHELPVNFWLQYLSLAEPRQFDEPDVIEMDDIGRAFAEDWLCEATEGEVEDVRSAFPRIPSYLDAELLDHTDRDLTHFERRRVREAFWSVVSTQKNGEE